MSNPAHLLPTLFYWFEDDALLYLEELKKFTRAKWYKALLERNLEYVLVEVESDGHPEQAKIEQAKATLSRCAIIREYLADGDVGAAIEGAIALGYHQGESPFQREWKPQVEFALKQRADKKRGARTSADRRGAEAKQKNMSLEEFPRDKWKEDPELSASEIAQDYHDTSCYGIDGCIGVAGRHLSKRDKKKYDKCKYKVSRNRHSLALLKPFLTPS